MPGNGAVDEKLNALRNAKEDGDLSPKASSLSSPLLDNQGGKITNGENNEATQTINLRQKTEKVKICALLTSKINAGQKCLTSYSLSHSVLCVC